MKTVYFDNSATTPLLPSVKVAMADAMEIYGNPSSLHGMGIEAEKAVSSARRTILSALGVRQISKITEQSLVFTAGGTEADNLALIGAATAKNFPTGKKIIISDSEHPAVMEPAEALSKRGFNIVRIPTKKGIPDYRMIEDAADKDTVLVSFMLVNNETGAVYDIKRISQLVKGKNPGAIIHTDCVQGFMNLPFSPRTLGADMISISAHKIGGPKGVGALYIAPDLLVKKQVSPIIFGGGQESGIRSGTENVLGIVGFGEAVSENMAHFEESEKAKNELYSYLVSALSDRSRFPDIKLNIPENHAPNIISVSLPGIKSETMLHSLSAEGIFISSGSACASNTGHKSHVLRAYGLTEREIDCTVRVSLSGANTLGEGEFFLRIFEEKVKSLVRMGR